jgi:hypothetical protein
MIIPSEEDYPEGKKGDLAVCYMLPLETSWSFEPVSNRKEADELFDITRNRTDVLTVPTRGRASAVVWIAECQGGWEWIRLKETEGAAQYLREVFGI